MLSNDGERPGPKQIGNEPLLTRSLPFQSLPDREAAERSALHSTAPFVMEARHRIRTARPDCEKRVR
jgi:hypothetical protein